MDAYDKLKLKGRQEFAEYRYYKGEKQCPYETGTPEFKWWNFEKRYHEGAKGTGKWKSFDDYFDTWIKERAAPETGHDLSTGNPWKDEYNAKAPF